MRKRKNKPQTARERGLAQLKDEVRTLQLYLRRHNPLINRESGSDIARRVVSIFEAALLFSHKEMMAEFGEFLTGHVFENNRCCTVCGKIGRGPICEVCELKEKTEQMGSLGFSKRN